MPIDLGDLFKKALKDERKVLRPYFFAAEQAEPSALVLEEVYIRLRLARMFLKHRRVLFQTKYPIVNALMRFAGMNGKVEVKSRRAGRLVLVIHCTMNHESVVFSARHRATTGIDPCRLQAITRLRPCRAARHSAKAGFL